jgi:O-antigen/teichoic acid export membrane protein
MAGCAAATEKPGVNATPGYRRQPNAVALALVAGLGGLLVAGVLGGAAGLVAGAAASVRARRVLLGAALALVATAAFSVLEQPLTDDALYDFPLTHTDAEFFAKLAATLLLAGLLGSFARDRGADRTRAPHTASVDSREPESRATVSVPMSKIAGIAAAALIAALALWLIGDRRWAGAAPAVAVTIVGVTLLIAAFGRLRPQAHGRFLPFASPGVLVDRLRHEHTHMLSGSIWLLAATLVVSLGSFLFWLLVTQRAPAEDVGRAAALFSASLFVCYLTSLGLPVAVSRYAPDRSQGSATLFAWSLVLTIGSSLVGVLAFAAFAPESIRDALGSSRPGLAWLAVLLLVAGISISILVDIRLMALRRWPTVFLRSLLIAVLRLPFVLWVPDAGSAFYVYVVAAGGFALTGLAFLWLLVRQDGFRLRPLPTVAGRAARFAGVNYLGQLAVQAPLFAVPFVVLVQVAAVENARFYLSWGVMSVVYIGVTMIGQALLVEGGRGGADDRRQGTVALGAGLAVATSATILSLGLGPLLAVMYGPSYGPVSTLLPILVAGTIPFAVTTTVLTMARIREHSSATIAVAIAFAGAVLVPTVLLTASHGILGAAWGWALGNALVALVALLVSGLVAHQHGTRAVAGTPAPFLVPVPRRQRAGRRN